ncbi:MAG: PSD1 and planctomycete cytochrome C domain-containing protein [Verrucomicrobiales bacterium]
MLRPLKHLPFLHVSLGPMTAAKVVSWTMITPAPAATEMIDFNRDVRPILSEHCFACHGPDKAKRKADLRLDTRDGLFSAIDGIVPVVAGKPEQSEVIRRITSSDEDDVMPPPKANKKLKPEYIALLRDWIAQGAVFKGHWAFIPPMKPAVPEIRRQKTEDRGQRRTEEGVLAEWGSSNSIDAFVQAKQAEKGLSPSPEADRETLIRRVAFALTGLPPTINDIEEFVAHVSDEAFEKMVERYLASPHYGEQMARHWLDVARYGDTHGMHLDNERSMWPYRDWVVAAFNRNVPFDAFTIEQLAGDLLPHPTQEQLVATGFNRCNVTTGEGGSIDAEWLFRYAVDRTATTAETWLGLTAGCAVCHDHKFDPISQKEFYSLYAFFYSAADPALDGNTLLSGPTVQLISPAQRRQLDDFSERITAAEKTLGDQVQAVAYSDPAEAEPRPLAQVVGSVWVEDDAPAGGKFTASPGQPTQWVESATGRVFSGKRALRRQAKGLAQDVYEGASPPLEIPVEGKVFAHVFLEPDDVPRTIMLQFHKVGWLHRAVWGDYDAIQWGAADTTERVNMGGLPEAGKWVRLEVEAVKLGLQSGDKITGMAFTQFDGTVTWDKAGAAGRMDPAADPKRSLRAWIAANAGKAPKELPAEIRELLKKPAKDLTTEQLKRLREHYLGFVCAETQPKLAPLHAELAALKTKRGDFDAAIPATFVMKDLPQPRQAHVMMRGQYDKPGEPVARRVPAFLPPLANTESPTRLDLAKWLVAENQPLTARVAVNRFWQQFFGTGLVKSSGDFGTQSDPPSHLELLDWLAVTFRESGWDVKALARRLVTSQTFRQSSRITPELLKVDPDNRVLTRGPRLRLDAEEIRDNALCTSGLIDLKIGGKGVNPYQPPNIWEPVGFVGSNTAKYTQDHGDALYRRSLYTFLKRTAPAPFMANFDAPNREQFCTRRERSNTPLQALQLMNDVQHIEAARALAERLMKEGGVTTADRISFAYRTVLARNPDPEEVAVVQDTFARHLTRYQAHPEAAAKLIAQGESKPVRGLLAPELAAWTMVANLLLNLDETITRQ